MTLSVKGGQITFAFSHPYQVYKDTPTVKNLNRLYLNGCEECKMFKYSVLYNGMVRTQMPTFIMKNDVMWAFRKKNLNTV